MSAAAVASLGTGALTLVIVGALLGRAAPHVRSITPPPTPDSSPAAAASERRLVAWLRRRGTEAASAVSTARLRRLTRREVPAATVAAWCDAIARRLRSGETLRQVLTTERPAHRGLAAQTAPLRRRLGNGDAVAAAVSGAAAASGRPPLDLVWSVVAVTSGAGGKTAEALDRAACALRLRGADADERLAQSAQARLSAHVLTAVPLAVLALLVAIDPEVRLVVTRPAGWSLVAAGLVLNLTGWGWMRRIVASSS